MKTNIVKKGLLFTGALVAALALIAPAGFAAETAEAAADSAGIGSGLRAMGLAIGAGLAMLGAALGTGRAQGSIGAGGTGVLAEKPELFGRIFILVALPETIVVLGFVIAILMFTAI